MVRVTLICKEVWVLAGNTGGWLWVGGLATVMGVGLTEADRGGERQKERVGKRESESEVAGAFPRLWGQG